MFKGNIKPLLGKLCLGVCVQATRCGHTCTSADSVGSPGAGVIGGCELINGC